jgi:capsid protein
LGPDGQPLRVNGHSQAALLDAVVARTAARLQYDAARDTPEFANHWLAADHLDADSAHNPVVRRKLRSRSRYEAGSNGYYSGSLSTAAQYLVGAAGPSLRMLTGIAGFDRAVEISWYRWAKEIQLRRKLLCIVLSWLRDGEGFAIAANNPKLRGRIKLDLQLLETDSVSHGAELPWGSAGVIDGIEFDAFGNPETYMVIPHPGGAAAQTGKATPIPAEFMLHVYSLTRANQHRGVPGFTPSLNTGAGSRRYREAVLSAAETAADLPIILRTMLPPEEAMSLAPFGQFPMPKRSSIALPEGWQGEQMDAVQPTAQYESFLRSQCSELGRPKSMPASLVTGDASDVSFSGAKVETTPFYLGLGCDREDLNDTALDKLFSLWWSESVREFNWQSDPETPPDHQWDYPQFPVADEVSDAQQIDKRLRNGTLSLSAAYALRGLDFEDEVAKMAADYGVSADEVKRALFRAIFNDKAQQADVSPPTPPADPAPTEGSDANAA